MHICQDEPGLDVYTSVVYTGIMLKNITFSADASMIEEARRRAAQENTTLNDLFRMWLSQYVARSDAATEYEQLMAQLRHVRVGGRIAREDMNERG